MNKMRGQYVALVILVVLSVSALGYGYETSASRSCKSSSDCAVDECCVLSMNRYSIPACTKLRQRGEPCRRFNAPTTTTVYNGNGTEDVVNVYMSLCGCADGLMCSLSSKSCE